MRTVEVHQLRHVEVGEDVAVDDDERLVDACRVGSETNGTGRVERLGFDGVAHGDTGTRAIGERLHERLGLETQRERHLGDATTAEAGDQPLDDG